MTVIIQCTNLPATVNAVKAVALQGGWGEGVVSANGLLRRWGVWETTCPGGAQCVKTVCAAIPGVTVYLTDAASRLAGWTDAVAL